VALVVLVETTTFSFALLRRIEGEDVPNLGVTVAGSLVLVGLILFLLFLDRFLHRMRPVAVAAFVAATGRRAFVGMLAAAATPERPDVLPPDFEVGEEPVRLVRSTAAGAIQAIQGRGLVRFARAHGCRLILRQAVGDFVTEGAVLVEVYGNDPGRDADRRLRGLIAFGVERTIEQDPAFAIRIMVDIASRALSPGGERSDDGRAGPGPPGRHVAAGGFDAAARACGAAGGRQGGGPRTGAGLGALPVSGGHRDQGLGSASVQVMRRLRALLEELRESVLPERRAAVDAELARLDATVRHGFGDTVDLDLASGSDRQGIGGHVERGRSRARRQSCRRARARRRGQRPRCDSPRRACGRPRSPAS
jgi:Predicted membrane protein (DUF2254)